MSKQAITIGELKSLVKEAMGGAKVSFEDVSGLAHDVDLYQVVGRLHDALIEKLGDGPEAQKWLMELVTDAAQSDIDDRKLSKMEMGLGESRVVEAPGGRKRGPASSWKKDAQGRPSGRYKLSHLNDVKELDKRAFDAWVNYLVEDDKTRFSALGDGRIEAKTPDGRVLLWDPDYTMGEWEPK